ncbi:hypothetical protein B0G73_12156 [Paraburkholderia sp. BL25I1N1]|nr:hypothetical protein B0G73_12156 [Paraburkholderia sp. BL25I1N1]
MVRFKPLVCSVRGGGRRLRLGDAAAHTLALVTSRRLTDLSHCWPSAQDGVVSSCRASRALRRFRASSTALWLLDSRYFNRCSADFVGSFFGLVVLHSGCCLGRFGIDSSARVLARSGDHSQTDVVKLVLSCASRQTGFAAWSHRVRTFAQATCASPLHVWFQRAGLGGGALWLAGQWLYVTGLRIPSCARSPPRMRVLSDPEKFSGRSRHEWIRQAFTNHVAPTG